jgi:Ca-activated chloride channel family protein
MKRVAVAVAILVVALGSAVAWRVSASDDGPPLVITHWSNSHPLREGVLSDMAEEFNDADHETPSGQPIEVRVVSCDSAVQAADLVARVGGSGPALKACKDGDRPAADPTIVTPQSSDWLVDVNHQAGRQVIDLDATENLAETWLGIVTWQAMAECLGWPERELGYEDILALAADPDGWAAYPDCARAEWGRRPLLAFTNPNRSTSGRNVLVSLYSMAAGKQPEDLTLVDVQRPEVVEFVQDFQQLVDHYLPTTLLLNTKIHQGPEYGHFFLMPEDNLVSLVEGREEAIGPDGTTEPLPATDDLVMIYPKEGSVLNANPAGVVDAHWVTADAAAAARQWIDFVREDEQQRRFMSIGFRPASGTGLEPDARQFTAWGLDPRAPAATIEPGELQPEVLEHIIGSWGAVKNPAIVTLVVDTSTSMEGEPLEQVKDGLTNLLDAIAVDDGASANTQVGLVTFATRVDTQLDPASLAEARYDIHDAILEMDANGNTALYDAIDRAVRLTDRAEGEPRATRAVVVLSDGEANEGRCLHEIVAMTTADEEEVDTFCGMDGDDGMGAAGGRTVSLEDIRGESLAVPHENDVQIFFLSFGTADGHIGRILAQATGAEYQDSTDENLAAVIEELSGYF